MNTSFIIFALGLFLLLAVPALADGTHTYSGPRGGTSTVTHSSDGTTASRSATVDGAYGGSASLAGSCTQGNGCSRSWSRTLRNGATASGSATAQRGVGVSRTGTGFRGRNW